MSEAKRDQNYVPTLLAVSSADGVTPVPLYADPTTHRLYVDLAGGLTTPLTTKGDIWTWTTTNARLPVGNNGEVLSSDSTATTGLKWVVAGAGTVTTVSVATANGFAGNVATATSTPAITLTTSITGVIKGNGTAISAATAGTDYSLGTSALATGIVKSTTTTGALTIAIAADFPTLNQNTTGSAATLTTTRTIWGQNFNGSANVTGNITLGASSITLTGSIGATGGRATKVWATDIETTNMPTVGGTAILSSLTAPQFTTIELGAASDTTLSRVSAGVIAVEGVTVPTISSTSTLTNKRITKRVVTTTDDATAVIDVDVTDVYQLSAVANATTFSTTGTPTDGQPLVIRFKDAGTAKGLTWDAVFVAIGVTLPTTTVVSKWHYVGCTYNSAASKWHVLAVGAEA
jgi:hypothetical protein